MPLTATLRRCVFQILRAGFRLAPLPVATRDRLRQRFLAHHAKLVPEGPRGLAPSSSSTRRPYTLAGERAIGYVPYRIQPLPAALPATIVAFYLPQFHPIPENDVWWGAGFTEWSNVTRALPQFEGHEQPRLPGELGFYDLRHVEVMRRQMQLAREYGVGAFCTYFYWFAGKTLLEAPLRQWLEDSSLDLPICLCWANENWSRRWDGRAEDILIGQRHSAEDDLAFIAYVAPYLADPRYLRVGGKPMLLVYRPGLLPDPSATAQRWRAWCREQGLGEIHLAYVQSFDRVDPGSIGFDAAVEFPPNNTSLPLVTASQRLINPSYRGDVLDWRALAQVAIKAPAPAYCRYPGVNPGWDNEPRRSGCGRVYAYASPRGYGDWLAHAINTARQRIPDAPMVFVNAWNEWAEGAVLEPDTRLGYASLEATRQALRRTAGLPAGVDMRPCAVIHAWYVEVLDELLDTLRDSGIAWRIIVTTAPEQAAAARARLDARGSDAQLAVYDNRGRDVLPFLHIANQLLDEGVEVVLKLHTKRSTHRDDGATWRAELLHRLAAPGRAASLLAAFGKDATLGLVGPEEHMPLVSEHWGANREAFDFLLTRLGLPTPDKGLRFVAGSMFWCRLQAMRPLLDAHLPESLFEAETGQIDGTLAHAIERIFVHVVHAAGYQAADAGRMCGGHDSRADVPYRYAKRG